MCKSKSEVKSRYLTKLLARGIVALGVILALSYLIAKPLLEDMMKVYQPKYTVSNGVLTYVGSVTDYLNGLIHLDNCITHQHISLMIIFSVGYFIYIAHSNMKIKDEYAKLDSDEGSVKVFNNSIKKASIILIILGLLCSASVIFFNRQFMSNKYEITMYIDKERFDLDVLELEKNVGIQTLLDDNNTSYKRFEVYKGDLEKDLGSKYEKFMSNDTLKKYLIVLNNYFELESETDKSFIYISR